MRLAACILVLTALWIGAGAAEARTTFEGRWTCTGRAVADARVELWPLRAVSPVDPPLRPVARGWTNDHGRFALVARGDERGQHFVRLLLEDRTGVHVTQWPNQDVVSDSPVARTGPRRRNLGAVPVEGDTVPCELLRALRRARTKYRNVVGAPLPYDRLRARVNSGLAAVGGAPLAHYTTIHWPPGRAVDMTAVRHELGHTVRHRLDGSYRHFLGDLAAFLYTQPHTFCQQTEPGFAFNEGWAAYWSLEYLGQSCPDPENVAVEGNVALALADLQRRCDLSRGDMVAVLRRNPGSIHSYAEFEAASCRLQVCPGTVLGGFFRGITARNVSCVDAKRLIRRWARASGFGRRLPPRRRQVGVFRCRLRMGTRAGENPVGTIVCTAGGGRRVRFVGRS